MALDDPLLTEEPEVPLEPAVVDGASVTPTGDGVVVDFDPQPDSDEGVEVEFDKNLVDSLDETFLNKLAGELIEQVDADKESRKDWFARIEKGLELLGIKSVPGENLPFEGASSVVHPLIAEGVVQFQARAIAEVFPPSGPVRSIQVGNKTKEKEEQAERVQRYMNYQFTEKDPDYFWNVDDMLMYLPLAGSAFKKVYFDPLLKMPISRFVRAEEFIVPYMATSLRSATRYTHEYVLSANDVEAMKDAAYFADVELTPSLPGDQKQDYREMVADQADDRSVSVPQQDEDFKFYEVHTSLKLKTDGEELLPYHVTVEVNSQKIVAIYRNWDEDDVERRRIERFVHYKYLPGLGFYGFGLLHIVGSVAEAAIGSLRALLDTAAFSNMQGGFKSKDVKIGKDKITVSPGKWVDVESTAEDLQKAFFPFPFKEPSPALMELLKFLVEGTQRFMSTTEAMVGDASTTGPVGTTVALIEQGSKIFSAIHKRLHVAARDEFRLVAKLNYLHMPDEGFPLDSLGIEGTITREDFDDRVDVLPVSDPNIFSQTQRIAIAQNVLQLSTSAPQLYDQREVHMRMLKAMEVPDAEVLLVVENPVRLDPVTENQLILLGQGVRAYADQNHQAHMMVHQSFQMQMMQQMPPEQAQMMGAAMAAHLAEHMAHQYRLQIEQALGSQLMPVELYKQSERVDLPPEYDEQVAIAVAQAFPPQPPPPSPEEEEAARKAQADEEDKARQAEKDARDEERKAKNDQRKDAELERKNQEAAAEQERKDAAFAAEQERKDAAASNEQVRKDLKLIDTTEGNLKPKTNKKWFEKMMDAIRNLGGPTGE